MTTQPKARKPSAPEPSPPKQDREAAKHDYENLKADVADRLKFQVEYSHAALRGLTLVNGGAIVALFTLIGASRDAVDTEKVWVAFALFAAGLVFMLMATGSAFFSQSFYMKSSIEEMWNEQAKMLGRHRDGDFRRDYRRGGVWETIGVICAVLSLVSFIGGAGFALAGGLHTGG